MTGQKQTSSDARTWLLLRIGAVWQFLMATGLAVVAVLVWVGILFPQAGLLARLAGGAALMAMAVVSAWGAVLIFRRNRRGRVMVLIVDYLLFVACLAISLQRLGLFVGIDGLAANFGRGLLPLLGLFVAYLIAAQADRFQGKPEIQERLQMIGRWVAIAAVAWFLLSVGLLSGLWVMVKNLVEPLTLLLVLLTVILGFSVWAIGRSPAAVFLRTTNAQTEMLEEIGRASCRERV